MNTESQITRVLPPATVSTFEGKGELAQRGMMDAAIGRQAQEVQAAMFMAKQFPRDQLASYQRILRACERPGLAQESMYAYPRGGQQVTGPTIRLAEVLAQNWGNIDFGIIELEQRPGKESIVMSYCVDLETNTRRSMVFTVPHVREKRSGNEILTDPRDIYELVSNQGSRRLRACILGVIPGDVIDDAIAKCEETLTKRDQSEGPLIDRVKKLSLAYQKIGVTTAMMEMRLGRKSDAWTEFDYTTLKKIFLSIRDGMAKKEDFFSLDAINENKPAPQAAAPAMPQEPATSKAARKPKATPEPAAPVVMPDPVKQPEADLPLPGAEPEPQDETPPLEQVIRLIKRTSGVSSADALLWLKENRVISSIPEKLGNLPSEALLLLVEKWEVFTSDTRGE